jgi:hypothetical protein
MVLDSAKKKKKIICNNTSRNVCISTLVLVV